ncbi:S8 family peptidase [Flammeovirga agarivorans]|uniref:S8 family serine peptidase n=1 Tax=Flammeovirga agarivorans TaxID=2726742 RepID=A0A7X8SM61_9BACT|nr:S8 family peptidase [Flammeovirga agarivorans]NLR92723.1 S8 family serine peptidase [Flammeovirga agarivorans]
MTKSLKRILLAGALVAHVGIAAQAQDPLRGAPENWYNLDYEQDSVYGVGAERAYNEILKGKKSKKVVVAVIDSGIDIDHEDLKSVIWHNTKEVAGNGQDDDKNGYIDDVDGWNFIGGADGEMVNEENLEVARLYGKLSKKFEGVAEEDVAKADKKEYELWLVVKKDFESGLTKAEENYARYDMILHQFKRGKALFMAYFDLESEDEILGALETLETQDEVLLGMAQMVEGMTAQGATEERIAEGVKYFQDQIEYNYNPELNTREIVGDDITDLKQKNYGNNKVMGPDATHGTHVAGIIGADRTNDLGIKGVADNVEIMVVRTVPNGDERDKDVANSIIYAVDNGADIINMSFGKPFSPNKDIVDAAIKYADSKGVLLVHAAGNDNKNTDKERNFPKDKFNSGKTAKNWIEVGASTWHTDEELPAYFSNYAKKNVDLFAPGFDIYSTVPGSEYQALNGTSMASPVVAGCAAVLMSYYPNLSAYQVKKILMKTVTSLKSKEVLKPGYKDLEEGQEPEKVKFGSLSVSGGVINLYEAVKYAEKISK